MSIKISIECKRESDSTNKAKELAQRIIAKANDKSVKFPQSKANSICPCCLGTGTRYVYRYGKRLAKRCESALWDEEKKKLICFGNPNAEDLELANRKDLISQIWKIVMFVKEKESFLLWLEKEYKTQSLSSFSLQQLELILHKVRSNNIFSTFNNQNSLSSQQPKPKAA